MKSNFIRICTCLKDWLLLIVILHICISSHSIEAGKTQSPIKPWEKSWRLPTDTDPNGYELRMKPNIEDGTFEGQVKIFYYYKKPKDYVILHSKNLNISNIEVFTDGLLGAPVVVQPKPTKINVAEWFFYPKHEFLVVKFDRRIDPDIEVRMTIDFSGSLLDGKLNGFYRSQYKDNGQIKYLATTKFEPNHARTAFPCFDEPGMKAAFDIEIINPSKTFTSLSNAMEMGEMYRNDSEDTTVRFKHLTPMPTYTISFITSEFKIVEKEKTKNGVEIRGMAREGHEGSMKYATIMTKKSLEYFEDYLGLKYPLEKLDVIGIPDFSSGAMENMGLITFKETNVMINPETSGYLDYFAVVNVICHEVAHMWFGNLITMKWWDDIWLNEGFATYFSMKCTKALQPELITDELGYVRKKLSALQADAHLNSHPIINNVTANDQLSGVFDEIAYRKGYSLLEMLENYLGEEVFRKALQNYVAKHENFNADTSDLIVAFEKSSDLYLAGLMRDWTKQAGYPLVNVEKQGRQLILTQKRFTNHVDSNRTKLAGYRWDIPITYRTSSDPNSIKQIFFDRNNDTAIINLDKKSDWFKLNAKGVGFYRVNYPSDIWESYQQCFNNDSKMLSDWSDRANLLDDACNLATTGHIKYEIPLSLFSYLQEGTESHYAPWRVASKCLNDIKKRLPPSGKTNELFSQYTKQILERSLQTTLESLAKNSSSPFEYNPANEVILSLGCAFKHPVALKTAKTIFESWINGGEKINPDIRQVVYRYGINGEEESKKWEKVWEKYQEVEDPHELRDLRVALVSVKNNDLLKRLIQMSKNESLVRTQDYYAILSTMATKKKTNAIVWDLFRTEYKELESKFSGGKLSKLFQNVASNFYTKNKLKEVKEFIKEHPKVVPHKRDQKKVEESINNNIKWKEMHEKDLRVWLLRRI